MSINQISLLGSRRFFPLFVTQFLGAFNDNVYKNALVILITYRLSTDLVMNSQVLVTMAAGIFILPFFLFSATAGQLADKYEKTRLMIIIKFAEIVIMILASAAFYYKSVFMLLLILFLLGIQAAFFGPLKYSILPNLLHNDELIAGNGLIEAGTFVSILLGIIFGGVLVLLPYGEYHISLATCTISILGFLASLYVPKTYIQNLTLAINPNFITETWRVIQYSKERSDIFVSIVGISWFWLLGAIYLAEFPVFAKDVLHADQYVVTLFIAIFSVGIAIGSLLCNVILKGKVSAAYVPLACLGMMVFGVDLYFAANHVTFSDGGNLLGVRQFLLMFSGCHIMLDLAFIAICGGFYTVPLYAILQQRSHESYRARVIASNNVVNAMFMVLSSIATMLMLKMHFTVTEVFLTAALCNIAIAVYVKVYLPR